MQETADEGLARNVCDADSCEDGSEVIRRNSHAVPLRKDTKGDGDEETVTVALGLEHVDIRGGSLGKPLHLEGALDLSKLKSNKPGVFVASSVGFDEERAGLLDAVLAKEPTGGFGCEEQAGDNEDGDEDLKEARHTPGPVVTVVAGTVGGPGCDKRACCR